MYAMRQSVNDDMFQKDNGWDIKATESFDVNACMNECDDDQLMDAVRNFLEMDNIEERNDEPSLHFEDEQRDGSTAEDREWFTNELESGMVRTCEDFGSMPYCPVDTQRGDDFLGLTPTYLPNQAVSQTPVYKPNVTTTGNAPNPPQTNIPCPLYHAEAPRNEDSGYVSPFNDSNENNLKPAMIHKPRASVSAVSVTRNATVPATNSHTVMGSAGSDYRSQWQQHNGLEGLDFFAETIQQPQGLKTVSIADLGLIAGKHCVVKTQLGLALLLDSEDPSNGNIERLQQNAPQPTSNVFGVHDSNPEACSTDSRKFQRWTPQEDQILKMAVETEGGPPCNWKRIASKYFSNVRSSVQCKSRWTKVLKPGVVRGAWTPEEDATIIHYRQEGLKWFQIAEYLPGRIGEHICDRYCNFLDPTLKKTPWTPEEDSILFEEQRRLGNKWTQISRSIPGRSENMVKNRWHNLKVTRQRKMRQAAAKNTKDKSYIGRSESPQPFVITPQSSACSVSPIVDAPPVHKNAPPQYAPPRNAHTIFRSTTTPSFPTTSTYQV